jgi:Ca2+-transporting ATPase
VSVGDFTDAAVIAMVIVVNTTVGVIQEVKADRAVTALASLSAPRARVIRDGQQQEIAAADVVPGDALVLAEGIWLQPMQDLWRPRLFSWTRRA